MLVGNSVRDRQNDRMAQWREKNKGDGHTSRVGGEKNRKLMDEQIS